MSEHTDSRPIEAMTVSEAVEAFRRLVAENNRLTRDTTTLAAQVAAMRETLDDIRCLLAAEPEVEKALCPGLSRDVVRALSAIDSEEG